MDRITTFCLFVLICATIGAQDTNIVTVKGRVIDTSKNLPLSDASVYVEETKEGTTTDSNGNYILELPQGTYTLAFSYSGYRTVRKKTYLTEDLRLDIELEESPVDLDEVTVSGEKRDDNVQGLNIGLERIQISDINELPTFLGEVDVIKTLLLLPGVNTVGEGASGFNVRGGQTGQNLILLNGATLFNPSHVLGLFSSFNADAVESFNLYKGHTPARFGGRLSSVLEVESREGNLEDYKVDLGIGVLTGKVLVEGPIVKDKTSFLVSGRAAYSDWVLGLATNPDIKNSSLSFYDINTIISHNFNSSSNLKLSYYGSNDRFQFSEDFGFSWHTDAITAKWATTFGSDWGLDLTGIYSDYKATSFDPAGPDAFELDTGIGYYQGRAGLVYAPKDSYTFRAGGEYTDYDVRLEKFEQKDANGNNIAQRVPKEQAREISSYLEGDVTVAPWLSLSLGLRYTLFQNYGPYTVYEYGEGGPIRESNTIGSTFYGKGEVIKEYSGLEPRTSARILLGKNNSIKLSYNRTRQFIHSVSNSASPTPADLWQMSNTYFEPQVSDNFSLGYFHNFNDSMFEASLEGFYKDIKNQVEYRDFAELFLNDQLEIELASGTGEAYGVEFSLKKTAGNWTGWLSYAYTRSLVTLDSGNRNEQVNNGNPFPSNFDQPHKLNIVAKKRLGKKSAFSTSFTYITGRPFTAINGSFTSGPTVIPIFTERNGEQVPDYVRLDVSFTIAENIWPNRIPNPNRGFEDSLSISFYNVLNRRNAFSVFYQRPDDRPLPVANQLSVIGTIVPSVTYNISF